MTLPGTIQAMIEKLIHQHQLDMTDIANHLGVSVVTIRRLLAGNKPSRHTQMQLIRFYCRVCA